ncbi:MAG: acetyl-CoA carboxylase biotin carboxylase subunit [Alphaproteobacteria bacterium]|nr:acetyl-CoA carboxylase biotin carboxylase subunit [Alphaproteobacteria bacterium]
MLESLLIANRGEIACRIARTSRRLGIRTIAVYSQADREALHLASADQAVCIGPAPARESYLNGAAIIRAARAIGAAAIHPGYGFLSENADFAEACLAAGLVFVGPPPAAIRAMGSKSASKDIMRQAGVPLVPGYHGDDRSMAVWAEAADAIGYPVLVKASAGGGGRGMRIVDRPEALGRAVEGARREAMAAFADDSLLLEKYLPRPRHVEAQVFADSHGNVVHLFERDCSIQRRHQKIVEEAPAPGLAPRTRQALVEAGVAAARAIGYVGAGTVEFLVDPAGAFYFIEMNTRLQVEHPVTEFITGRDLVEWQLRVASGERLPVDQAGLTQTGHAIEVRLCAEDPARKFLPQTGVLRHLRYPEASTHVRVDSGVRQGDAIGMHYDPMFAKLIVWDHDRPAALRRLRRALADTQIAGVVTNLGILQAIAGHPAFAAGDVHTHFIEQHTTDLIPTASPAPDRVLALATLYLLAGRSAAARVQAAASPDPYSPWHDVGGWRVNDRGRDPIHLLDGARRVDVGVAYEAPGYRLTLPEGDVVASAEIDRNGDLVADLDGVRLTAAIVSDGAELVLMVDGASHRLTVHDPMAAAAGPEVDSGALTAPMPGKIVKVLVKAGDEVKRGAPLIVLEAMKMEHTINAPADGRVRLVAFAVGDVVEEGVELVAFGDGEAA